jgi:hypothetical protein
MNTYTLHLPRDARPGDADALERAELVKDGFSWGAFLFTFLWFFVHRLWVAGLGVLIVVVAFDVGLALLNVHPAAGILAQVLLSLLIGLEANSLRRWTYGRRGRPVVDVVIAPDEEAAETKAFGRWLDRSAQTRSPGRSAVAPTSSSFRGSEPVIGLFPEAERPR